jgi:hypothetical protein
VSPHPADLEDGSVMSSLHYSHHVVDPNQTVPEPESAILSTFSPAFPPRRCIVDIVEELSSPTGKLKIQS